MKAVPSRSNCHPKHPATDDWSDTWDARPGAIQRRPGTNKHATIFSRVSIDRLIRMKNIIWPHYDMMISNLHKGNSLAVKLCYVLLSDRFVSFFQASSTFRSTPDQRKKTAGFRGQFPNLCKTNMLGMHLRNLLGMRIFVGCPWICWLFFFSSGWTFDFKDPMTLARFLLGTVAGGWVRGNTRIPWVFCWLRL